MSEIKKIFGIDTLYFFFETNQYYDDLFLEILDQLEDIKGKFEKREVAYEKRDIEIVINDISLQFLGKKEGFYWFKDHHELFRIGFKDYKQNRGLNDIRVQLQGNGIYTIGINSILKLLKNQLLTGYISEHVPVTRADLNCFIQHDFSFVKKDMFSTRKRRYSTINEIGDANSTQTIYIGKEPFKLRLYNKGLELKKSKKFETMSEYFLNHEFDLDEAIFNIEFQMNRSHLRQYNIETVDNLVSNAKNLFQQAMDDIRLLDMDSVSQERIKNNKYQAKTHPLWEEIKQQYTLKEFLQSSLPLERIKRKLEVYSDLTFEYEYKNLLKRAFINRVRFDLESLESLYFEVINSFKESKASSPKKWKNYTDVDIVSPDGTIQKRILRNDGSLVKSRNLLSVKELDDYSLLTYIDDLKTEESTQKIQDMTKVAINEAVKRTLIKSKKDEK